MLEFRNLKKSYGDKEILHGLNFTVKRGRPMAFLGRNGAGKTTTIRSLMGVFHPDSGEILLDGKPLQNETVRFGYLPEERGMYGKDTILRQLIYFGTLRGGSREESKASALSLLEKVGLLDYKDKKLETLSKGNQQKVQIVEALLNDPEILVLDEPFSGLDPMNSKILMNLLKEHMDEGKILLFSSHQMSYVEEICTDLTLIDSGNVILTGDLEQIRTELGKGKIRLSVENKSLEELKAELEREGYGVEADEKTLIVDLKGQDKNQLLQKLLDQNLDIRVFMMYRPSVADIFIDYTGQEVEHE